MAGRDGRHRDGPREGDAIVFRGLRVGSITALSLAPDRAHVDVTAELTQDGASLATAFDYIRESRSQSLILALYELLADGGMLTIGNACAPQKMFWSAEFLVDWTILYRTRDEVLRMAALLPKNAEVDVVLEPGEAYYFLTIRKP